MEIAVMGQEIQEVKAALGGTGVYLGITDRDQLFSELQLLRKKEVQLREEMLGLLRLKPAVAKGEPEEVFFPLIIASHCCFLLRFDILPVEFWAP